MRILLLLSALLLTACASTPQGRIEKYPELFAKVPTEQQPKVREGKLELGFTPEAVLLAAGSPDRRVEKTTPEGSTEIWHYYQAVPVGFVGGGFDPCFYSRFNCFGGGFHPGFYGGFHPSFGFGGGFPPFFSPFYGGGVSQFQDALVITFKDGRVVSIERDR
jgi:hypothetical protein